MSRSRPSAQLNTKRCKYCSLYHRRSSVVHLPPWIPPARAKHSYLSKQWILASEVTKLCIYLYVLHFITTKNRFYRKTGVSVVALVNRFLTLSVKFWTANLCTHASKGQFIIIDQLNSIYNSPFKDSYSHPIHISHLAPQPDGSQY